MSRFCLRGADLTLKNKRDWSVLHEAVHPKAFIASKSLKKNRSKYFNILMGEITPNSKLLPIDVNAQDREGHTLLHYAVISSKTKKKRI